MTEERLVDALEDCEEEGDGHLRLRSDKAVPEFLEVVRGSGAALLGIAIPGLLDEGVDGGLVDKDVVEALRGDELHVAGQQRKQLREEGEGDGRDREERERRTPPMGPSMRSEKRANFMSPLASKRWSPRDCMVSRKPHT